MSLSNPRLARFSRRAGSNSLVARRSTTNNTRGNPGSVLDSFKSKHRAPRSSIRRSRGVNASKLSTAVSSSSSSRPPITRRRHRSSSRAALQSNKNSSPSSPPSSPSPYPSPSSASTTRNTSSSRSPTSSAAVPPSSSPPSEQQQHGRRRTANTPHRGLKNSVTSVRRRERLTVEQKTEARQRSRMRHEQARIARVREEKNRERSRVEQDRKRRETMDYVNGLPSIPSVASSPSDSKASPSPPTPIAPRGGVDGIDPDVLDALPSDIRAEVESSLPRRLRFLRAHDDDDDNSLPQPPPPPVRALRVPTTPVQASMPRHSVLRALISDVDTGRAMMVELKSPVMELNEGEDEELVFQRAQAARLLRVRNQLVQVLSLFHRLDTVGRQASLLPADMWSEIDVARGQHLELTQLLGMSASLEQKGMQSGLSASQIQSLPTKKLSKGLNENCCICVEPLKEQDEVAQMSSCSHNVHSACLATWLEKANNCPICRAQVISLI